MHPPNGKKHLFCTCFKFKKRFFDLNLYDDGSVSCYDNTAENEIAKADRNWDLKTDIYPQAESMKLLESLICEFTVYGQLPKYDLNFIIKKLMPGYRRQNSYRSTEAVCIRAILLRFFWEELNPQLSPPIPEGTAETAP